MESEQERVVERGLVQVIEIDANPGSGAARRALLTSYANEEYGLSNIASLQTKVAPLRCTGVFP